MLNISRVLVLPAVLAANTMYLLGDGSADGLQVVMTGSTGAVVKKTKTTAEIQTLINNAAGTAASDLAAALATLRGELSAGDAATELAAKTYTDSKDAAARTDLTNALNAGDAAGLVAAKAYTDTREAAILAHESAANAQVLADAKTYADGKDAAARTDFAAADAANLATAKAYTDTREAAVRTDMAADIAAAQSAAQVYSDGRLATEKTNILNTTDTKIATAIGALDMSNTAVFAADIAARDALELTKSSFVMVADATGDATVTAGAALYFYNLGADSYTKIAEYEGMHFMDLNQTLLAKLGEQDGLLTFNGVLVATVQHTGAEW